MASAFTGSFSAVFAPASVPYSASVKKTREWKVGRNCTNQGDKEWS